jgi:hypothetical protein
MESEEGRVDTGIESGDFDLGVGESPAPGPEVGEGSGDAE